MVVLPVKLTGGVLPGLVTNNLYKWVVKVGDVCFWMVSLDIVVSTQSILHTRGRQIF